MPYEVVVYDADSSEMTSFFTYDLDGANTLVDRLERIAHEMGLNADVEYFELEMPSLANVEAALMKMPGAIPLKKDANPSPQPSQGEIAVMRGTGNSLFPADHPHF